MINLLGDSCVCSTSRPPGTGDSRRQPDSKHPGFTAPCDKLSNTGSEAHSEHQILKWISTMQCAFDDIFNSIFDADNAGHRDPSSAAAELSTPGAPQKGTEGKWIADPSTALSVPKLDGAITGMHRSGRIDSREGGPPLAPATSPTARSLVAPGQAKQACRLETSASTKQFMELPSLCRESNGRSEATAADGIGLDWGAAGTRRPRNGPAAAITCRSTRGGACTTPPSQPHQSPNMALRKADTFTNSAVRRPVITAVPTAPAYEVARC